MKKRYDKENCGENCFEPGYIMKSTFFFFFFFFFYRMYLLTYTHKKIVIHYVIEYR